MWPDRVSNPGVRCPTDCATRPGQPLGVWSLVNFHVNSLSNTDISIFVLNHLDDLQYVCNTLVFMYNNYLKCIEFNDLLSTCICYQQ